MIKLVEVLEGLRTIRIADTDGLDTEVYLLECEGGLILIDVGFTPECHDNIQAELDEMNKDWSEIKMIIITHAHGDHINNLAQVKELTNAEVVLGEDDVDQLYERTGIRADVGLQHEDIIGACGGIEIIHVPGHSDGNLCLLLMEHKVIIAGDSIFGDSEKNLEAPPEKYCANGDLAAKSLSVLANYDFDKLLLSHGKNTMENAKEKVLNLIESCG